MSEQLLDQDNLTSRDVTLLNRLAKRPDWQIPPELFAELPQAMSLMALNKKSVGGELVDGGYSVRAQQTAVKLLIAMQAQNIKCSAVVLRHGREFDVLAQNELDDGIDATPALVGRRMYVRGRHALYCLEEGAGSATTGD